MNVRKQQSLFSTYVYQYEQCLQLNAVLTFEEKMRVILEGVVRLLHCNEAGVHCLPLLVAPWLCYQLGPELEDEAEDAVNDVHYRRRFLRQQAPAEDAEQRRVSAGLMASPHIQMAFELAVCCEVESRGQNAPLESAAPCSRLHSHHGAIRSVQSLSLYSVNMLEDQLACVYLCLICI